MAKPEWGTKRICLSCGARFYDFSRDPIVCPACEAPFAVAGTGRTRRNRDAAKPAAPKVEAAKPKKAAVDDGGDAEIATVDDDGDDDADDGDADLVSLDDADGADDPLAEADINQDALKEDS
ncbi:MAG: TIGR02300 family protein [Alphaproteobacteria bacterium]|nr:TIGR02300 family protein [Alphaproteobacteria bacterium]MDP6563667.1 TIGR02300 family protein [Alphaproteobacteria bacterium]MDP6814922.1 TIGR02300 family protein [Alphaproteobacteria bacterium]